MLLEGTLEFADDGTFQANMDIAPMLGRIGVARPMFCEANTPGETDFAIDHENAPMCPAIHFVHPPGASGMIVGEGASRSAKGGLVGIGERRPGADAVQKDAHPHPGLRPFAQGITKAVSDLI